MIFLLLIALLIYVVVKNNIFSSRISEVEYSLKKLLETRRSVNIKNNGNEQEIKTNNISSQTTLKQNDKSIAEVLKNSSSVTTKAKLTETSTNNSWVDETVVKTTTANSQTEAKLECSSLFPASMTEVAWVHYLKDKFTQINWIARVGMLMLFVGFALVLKYLYQYITVPIELKVTAIYMVAIILLVIGWHLRVKNRNYALIIQGGGLGILYMTTYASLVLFELLSAPVTYGLFAVISVIAVSLAIMQNALLIAIFAISLGFIGPIMIIGDLAKVNSVILFAYYMLLNISTGCITYFKPWGLLNRISFTFSVVIAVMWGMQGYDASVFVSLQFFLLSFFMLFTVLNYCYNTKFQTDLKHPLDNVFVYSIPSSCFFMQMSMLDDNFTYLAASAFFIGLIYLSLNRMVEYYHKSTLPCLADNYLILALTFLALAIPFYFGVNGITTTWLVIGSGLIWNGLVHNRGILRTYGMLLQLLAIGYLLLTGFQDISQINNIYLSTLLMAVTGIFSAYLFYQYREVISREEYDVSQFILVTTLFSWFTLGLIHIIYEIKFIYMIPAILIYFSLSCAVFGLLERVLKWPAMRFSAWCLITTVLVLLIPAQLLYYFKGSFYWFAWFISYVILYALLYQRESLANKLPGISLIHTLALWSMTFLLSNEVVGYAYPYFNADTVWIALSWIIVPLSISYLLVYYPYWPINNYKSSYIQFGLFPFVFILAIWAIIMLMHSGNTTPWLYLPLLNPLDITTMLIILLCVFKHKMKGVHSRLFYYKLGTFIFVWLSISALRTLHHWFDLEFSVIAISTSSISQTTLSLLWTFIGIGILYFANKKQLKKEWYIGGGILILVTAKLLLIDLAASNNISRMVSFLGVGSLMLLVSYFIPPPTEKEIENGIKND